MNGTNTREVGKSERANQRSFRHDLLKVRGKCNGQQVHILLDPGSTNDIVDTAFCGAAGIAVSEPTALEVTNMVTGKKAIPVQRVLEPVGIAIGPLRTTLGPDTVAMNLHGYEIILGKPWFTDNQPDVDWAANVIHASDSTWRLQAVDVNHIGETDSVNLTDESGVMYADPRAEYLDAVRRHLSVFRTKLPDGLPKIRAEEFRITLREGAVMPAPRLARLSHFKQQELEGLLRELEDTGKIRVSSAPHGAPVFLVKKHDGGKKRMVCDWRLMNAETVKDATPLPNIEEILARLRSAKILSKLDLNGGFHQVRVREEDIPLTAMKTHIGTFEWMVMPMGLSNAPATFQKMMNRILRPYLGIFVFVYLDDVLVFSDDVAEHAKHLHLVLSKLEEEKLYAKPTKCLIGASSLTFLGHVIGNGTLKADPAKTQIVRDFPVPRSVPGVRRFLGMVNYFRRFIPNLSAIAHPLHELTHKYAQFTWGLEQETAFKKLRDELLRPPILTLPDFGRPFIVATDASAQAIGEVLYQEDDEGERRVISYRSRALNDVQQRWPTHDRELWAIVDSLLDWRFYLEGDQQVIVETDHRPLTHFLKQRELTAKQLRWAEKLSDFNITIVYKPGPTQVVADYLSRPEISTADINTERLRFIEGYKNDGFFSRVRASPNQGETTFKDEEGLLYLAIGGKNRLCVPESERERVLQEAHDTPLAAHPGRDNLVHNLQRRFFWPKMRHDITQYVRTCARCQKAKPRNTREPGHLIPLQLAERQWESISMDFMTDLPRSATGNDALLVVVDRHSKMAHFIPCKISVTSQDTARLMVKHIIRLHGIPREIVSDRDPRFTSEVWEAIWTMLGTKLARSTPGHAQSDGQTERVNREINKMIRTCLSGKGDGEWERLLPLIEFAYNSTKSSSTGFSPFEVCTGRNPATPLSRSLGLKEVIPEELRSWEEITNTVNENAARAQTQQAHFADQHKSEVTFAIGQKVLVAAKRIQGGPTLTSKHKWQEIWRGPFDIIDKINDNAYRLKLPSGMRGHDVFNITDLKSWHDRDIGVAVGLQQSQSTETSEEDSPDTPRLRRSSRPVQPSRRLREGRGGM
jgi:hypothetical protein